MSRSLPASPTNPNWFGLGSITWTLPKAMVGWVGMVGVGGVTVDGGACVSGISVSQMPN